jgi:hypothetical protein
MDGHHTGLSTLARDHNKLQGLLVLHTPPDISSLGEGVSVTLLSLPDLFFCRFLNRTATGVVSERRALRPECSVSRAASPPPGLGSYEFGISKRGVAPFGRVFRPHA